MSGREGASVAPDPNWPTFRHALKQRFGDLPDEELETKARHKRELLGYIADRTGMPRAEAESVLDGISRDTGFRWR